MYGSLEHLNNVEMLISKVKKLLKPKGSFIGSTINKTINSYFSNFYGRKYT